jgi:hypothetical protein
MKELYRRKQLCLNIIRTEYTPLKYTSHASSFVTKVPHYRDTSIVQAEFSKHMELTLMSHSFESLNTRVRGTEFSNSPRYLAPSQDVLIVALKYKLN